MHILEIIEKKRDKQALSKEEIAYVVSKYVDGAIPDYQVASFLMATCINGMNSNEVSWLTDSMLYSGKVITHKNAGSPIVDKHSTGGVGDKISIPLAPAMAVCGLRVPMIAGRGLSHTGGTLDKLEAIPGFRCGLTTKEYQDQLDLIGCVIMGQTNDIAPADKKFYALRDVTGTVPSIPLISASIMSKKLAEGIDGLVLDVKFGSGAFMRSIDQAKALASSMVAIGGNLKKKVTALLTNMDQPLGHMIGNALEIAESIDILKGQGPLDSTELTIELGAEMLLLGNRVKSLEEGRKMVTSALNSGQALNKFAEMVKAQGGDERVVYEPTRLAKASNKIVISTSSSGFIEGMDCHAIGFASSLLGGGRCKLTDPIDHSVGIEMQVKIGDRVEKGQPLCTLHANDKGIEEARFRITNALAIVDHPVDRVKLCQDRITNSN